MRNRAQSTYWRKYEVDVHVFDRIDTEGKAYVLGFIAADGYVGRDGLGFTLHERDIDILEQIRIVLSSTHILRPIARARVVPADVDTVLKVDLEKVAKYKGARAEQAVMLEDGMTLGAFLEAGGDKGFLRFYMRDGAVSI